MELFSQGSCRCKHFFVRQNQNSARDWNLSEQALYRKCVDHSTSRRRDLVHHARATFSCHKTIAIDCNSSNLRTSFASPKDQVVSTKYLYHNNLHTRLWATLRSRRLVVRIHSG